MRQRILVTIFLVTLLALPLAAGERASHAERSAMRGASRSAAFELTVGQAIAQDLMMQSGWSADGVVAIGGKPPFTPGQPVVSFEREVLMHDVVHYTALLETGEGPYNAIRIHRVVKESSPYKPIKTTKNVFMLHGDGVGFAKFLFGFNSPNAPDEQSAAYYLAVNGVDVWAIDQNWALIPGEETDFDFLADQGMQRQIDNALLGIEIARYVRLYSGNGFGKINFLGYSSGGTVAYAAANQETQIPPGLRQIGGLIPVDIPFKIGPDEEHNRVTLCADVEFFGSLLDDGVYADETGAFLQFLGDLASSDPDGDSPVVPGLTNLQVALYFLGATYDIIVQNDWWHYMGAAYEDGLPAELLFTTTDGMLDFLDLPSPYEPVRFLFDYLTVFCDEADSPFDDHIGEISIPTLYLGARGGIGTSGIYTTTLLGSDDVTVVVQSLLPPEEILSDIGHVDIWTAAVSEETFWQPLLDWLQVHD